MPLPAASRASKAPKDGQQPCCTPTGRDHPSPSLLAATVHLSRSWEGFYRYRPLFTMVYHHHPQKR